MEKKERCYQGKKCWRCGEERYHLGRYCWGRYYQEGCCQVEDDHPCSAHNGGDAEEGSWCWKGAEEETGEGESENGGELGGMGTQVQHGSRVLTWKEIDIFRDIVTFFFPTVGNRHYYYCIQS